MWSLLLYVAAAGACGGVVNAIMTDKGFKMPFVDKVDDIVILQPGWIGNMIIGAVAAAVSWGLYGPLASRFIAGSQTAIASNVGDENVGLALSSLVGAVLIGIGGARWLTNEVDKNLLKAAASTAASAEPEHGAGKKIALASPRQALDIAKKMRQRNQ